jgi:phosphatidylglycerophosphatase A
VYQATLKALKSRGVELEDIASIVYDTQIHHNPTITIEDCLVHIHEVLQKREIQHALLTGIELDRLAEEKKLSQPLQSIIESDEGLFGTDEMIGFGASMTYGSIAITTFGFLDKQKVGIIKKLNEKNGKHIHTFLDDLVAAIAATAASRLAHTIRDESEQ